MSINPRLVPPNDIPTGIHVIYYDDEEGEDEATIDPSDEVEYLMTEDLSLVRNRLSNYRRYLLNEVHNLIEERQSSEPNNATISAYTASIAALNWLITYAANMIEFIIQQPDDSVSFNEQNEYSSDSGTSVDDE